jgi:hypothetical protein
MPLYLLNCISPAIVRPYFQTNQRFKRVPLMNSAALLVSDDLILRSEAKSVLSELRINCTCSGIMPFKKTLALT